MFNLIKLLSDYKWYQEVLFDEEFDEWGINLVDFYLTNIFNLTNKIKKKGNLYNYCSKMDIYIRLMELKVIILMNEKILFFLIISWKKNKKINILLKKKKKKFKWNYFSSY